MVLTTSLSLVIPVTAHEGSPKGSSGAVKNAPDDAVIKQEIVEFKYKDFFTCTIPNQWEIDTDEGTSGLSQEEKKIYGINLYAPVSGVIPVKISIYYYGKGNLLHKTMEIFVEKHSKPIFGVAFDGDRYSPVTEIKVSDRKSKKFERRKSEFIATHFLKEPDSDDMKIFERVGKPVPVFEQFVVVPAEKGFYVLRFYSPAETVELYKEAFDMVAGSFKPLR
jgi:hypothetical protein